MSNQRLFWIVFLIRRGECILLMLGLLTSALVRRMNSTDRETEVKLYAVKKKEISHHAAFIRRYLLS